MTPGLTSELTPGLTMRMTTDNSTRTQGVVTPESFLIQASVAEPGWSDQHGGPVGIVALCGALQRQLMSQSEQVAAIRVAAMQKLLETHSGREVAAMFGISPSAVSKAIRGDSWEDPTW